MEIQATLIAVNEVTKDGAKGPYKVTELIYEDDQGIRKNMLFMFKPRDKAAALAAIEAGPGATVTIEKLKEAGTDGNEYWNVAGINGSNPDAGTPSAATNTGVSAPPAARSNEFRKPIEIIRTSAIEQAVTLMQAKIASLEHGCTGLVKKTKLSGELMMQEVMADAELITNFITGEYSSSVESSTADLDSNAATTPADDDDIPY